MAAPRTRAAKSAPAGKTADRPDEAKPADDIHIGDFSHLDESARKGYVGELGDEGTNPNRED